MIEAVWLATTLVLAVGLSVAITARLLRDDMRRERELANAHLEVLVGTYKERAEYLETQVALYRTPSTNGHRAA